MTKPSISRLQWAALILGAALVACNKTTVTGAGDGSASFAHDDVVLKDRTGATIAPSSVEPYSPRQTCGECHDIDEIANGYHFQQGRTDRNGTIVTKTDYFGDGRDHILSPGMYGKW